MRGLAVGREPSWWKENPAFLMSPSRDADVAHSTVCPASATALEIGSSGLRCPGPPIQVNNMRTTALCQRTSCRRKDKGRLPACWYTVEYYYIDANAWSALVDKSDNTTAFPVDYLTFNEVLTHAVRLNILGTTENIKVGVQQLNVFGENYTLTAEKGMLDIRT